MKNYLRKSQLLLALVVPLVCAAPVIRVAAPAQAQMIAQSQQEAVRASTVKYLQKPGLPTPVVDRITIEGRYALANWLQGEAGGSVALISQDGTWVVKSFGGGMPTPDALSQRTGIPLRVARSLMQRQFNTPAPTVSQNTAVPMTISAAEEMMAITIPNQNTTQSAYGGRLRLYDVHIAKMFEVTHFLCKQYPGMSEQMWSYRAGGGSLNMGRFTISCNLASNIASAYGLGNPERTAIQRSMEEGGRRMEVYQVPILNITGGKVSRWLNFTQGFRPLR